MCEISPFLIFIFTLLFTTCRSFIAGLFWKLGAVAHLSFYRRRKTPNEPSESAGADRITRYK
jgi:hypothetical protein